VAALTRARARGLAALLGFAALACASASPVAIESLPGPEPGRAVKRIAVAPPVVSPRAGIVEADATSVIGSRVVEALAGQPEIEYVTPDEVAVWLEQRGLALATDPQQLGGELARTFGADAVLYAIVHDYVSRIGGDHGATRPAAVGFDLELRLPEGTRIWAGSYREEQRSLSDDVLSLPRAAERHFTWVDAPGLAAYGARELVRSLGEERSRWR
jgi:hypothetical protein